MIDVPKVFPYRGGGIVLPPSSGGVRPVRAGYCSHNDGQGRPIYDQEYFPHMWWRWKDFGDESAKNDLMQALAIKRRSGISDIVCDCPDGGAYFAEGRNWLKSNADIPNWMDDPGRRYFPMVAFLREQGFRNISYLFGGGSGDQPKIYNGELERWLRMYVAAGFGDGVYLWAWESFGVTHENTARHNSDAWIVEHRVLGDGGLIAGHIDPCYRLTYYPKPYEADCPIPEEGSANVEADAWYTAGGRFVKFFFGQFPPEDLADPAHYMKEYSDCLDRTDRRLNHPKFWFGAPRPAGDLVFVTWDPGVPFVKIRGQIDDAVVRRVHENLVSIGVEHFGCMPAA